MSITEEATSPRRPRPLVLAVVALVVLVVVTLLVRAQTGQGTEEGSSATSADATEEISSAQVDSGDEETSAPAPLELDTPVSGPIQGEAEDLERVTQTVGLVVDATNQIGERGDGGAEGLDSVATGFVLGELESLAREQSELGLTQTGEARLVSSDLVSSDLAATPPTMTISVCIDVSDLRLTDEAGNDRSDLLYNPGRPVRHIYGADYIDSVWKLSSHEIPDVQDCPLPEES